MEEIVHGALDGAISGSLSAMGAKLVKGVSNVYKLSAEASKKIKVATDVVGSAISDLSVEFADTGTVNVTGGDALQFGATQAISLFSKGIADELLDDNVLSEAWNEFTIELFDFFPETLNSFLELH